MPELTSLELTAGVAIVSTAISVFGGFLPGLSDVLNDNCSDGMRSNLNFAQPTAAIATTSVGVVLSLVTKSIMPTVFAVGISAMLWLVYEFAFQRVM
jgi:hypothetical protein